MTVTDENLKVLASLIKITEKLSDFDKGRLIGYGECMAVSGNQTASA